MRNRKKNSSIDIHPNVILKAPNGVLTLGEAFVRTTGEVTHLVAKVLLGGRKKYIRYVKYDTDKKRKR